ncbi:MAG: cytochrome c [Rhodospirillales bacterium]
MLGQRRRIAVGLLALLVVAAAPSAMADPNNEITYRRATMKALGGHMSALGTILSGRVQKGNASVMVHAQAIGNIGKLSHTLFPKGTDRGKTRAKPDIWTKTADFQKALIAFKQASAKLAAVAGKGNPNTTKAAYKVVGKACGSCHKPFRHPRRLDP